MNITDDKDETEQYKILIIFVGFFIIFNNVIIK